MSRASYKPFVVASIAPRVAMYALPVTHGPLRVTLELSEAPSLAGAEAERWRALCAANPKYFDGAIVGVVRLPVGDNTIVARVERYARLAVQPEVKTGVRMLAVTGVLLASDASGREHVLLGKRAKNVRCYPGMWEIGPSGGLEAKGLVANTAGNAMCVLSEADVIAQLAKEIEEEVGLCVGERPRTAGVGTKGMLHSRARASSVGILSDGDASSEDIVVVVQLAIDAHELMRELAPSNWEYEEVRIVPTDTLREFDEQYAEALIPPSRVLMRAMGWVGERV